MYGICEACLYEMYIYHMNTKCISEVYRDILKMYKRFIASITDIYQIYSRSMPNRLLTDLQQLIGNYIGDVFQFYSM